MAADRKMSLKEVEAAARRLRKLGDKLHRIAGDLLTQYERHGPRFKSLTASALRSDILPIERAVDQYGFQVDNLPWEADLKVED